MIFSYNVTYITEKSQLHKYCLRDLHVLLIWSLSIFKCYFRPRNSWTPPPSSKAISMKRCKESIIAWKLWSNLLLSSSGTKKIYHAFVLIPVGNRGISILIWCSKDFTHFWKDWIRSNGFLIRFWNLISSKRWKLVELKVRS